MIIETAMAIALSPQPKYKVGDCLTIDKIILNIRVEAVIESEYICTYWIPWLYKYTPSYRLSFKDSLKENVHKINCEEEKK